jgi:hypothetical protein
MKADVTFILRTWMGYVKDDEKFTGIEGGVWLWGGWIEQRNVELHTYYYY